MLTPARSVRFALCLTITLLSLPIAGDLGAQTTTDTYRSAADYCVLCSLGGAAGNPLWPKEPGRMVQVGDFLYTTTSSGGAFNNSGTITRVSVTNGKAEVLYSFALNERGSNPLSGLVDAGDGSFRGTTYTGGMFPTSLLPPITKGLGAGTVFSYRPGETPQILHVFRNNDLRGMRKDLCPPQRACQFSPQKRLNAMAGYPMSAPVRASNGVFYGVASFTANQKYGALYKVVPSEESGITTLCINGPMPTAPDLTDAQLRDMCLFNITNGNYPVSLTAGKAGDLYGVTLGGAAGNEHGTIFAATLDGRVTTLHRFNGKDGSRPYDVLVASDNSLYGTAFDLGTQPNGAKGVGSVWRMVEGRGFEVLHTFSGLTDGAQPISGLTEVMDPNGVRQFYGVTRFGGDSYQPRGVIYRVSENREFKVMHRNPANWRVSGRTPSTTLLAVGGALYGTTYQGGEHDGGTLFRVTDMDLPDVRQLKSKWAPTYGKVVANVSVPVPGQPEAVVIKAFAGSKVPPPEAKYAAYTNDGFILQATNCRNPHVLQFIYRERIYADGLASTEDYETSNGEKYPLTDLTAGKISWHTDGGGGRPNPFYDQGGGVARNVTPTSIEIFDQPTFDGKHYPAGAAETWRATFNSYVICNCRVAAVVRWAREAVLNPATGKQDPLQYPPQKVVILLPSEALLKQAEQQVKDDDYDPVSFLRPN